MLLLLLLLLLLLSHFSCVRLCATPEMAAQQALPSLRFSRQEHWSGLPFPSPMHGSEKWKWKWSRVQLLATPWTAAYQAPPSMRFARQEYWSGLSLPSPKSLHTYTETKHHTRANKFQSKTYHANSPATQEHSPEHQYTGCPKSHESHRHLKTHYWTLHCTPERRNPAPPTRTPTQASLTRKPWEANHPTLPTGRNRHNKEEPQTARIQKGQPKHSNLNKMKRQRNTQQIKEHNKCPPNQRGGDRESTWKRI